MKKIMNKFIVFLFFLLGCLSPLEITGQQLNVYLQSAAYQGLRVYGCSRLLNNTHVMGCQGKRTFGIIKILRKQQELDAFLSDGSNQSASYTVVIPYTLLNNLLRFKASNKVNAVVLMKDAEGFDKPDKFSSDRKCPNCQSFSKDVVDWNPDGTGLTFNSFDFPIFALWNQTNNSYVNHLTALIQAGEYNENRGMNEYPLYAAELDGFMNAGTNSETCLRRGRCEPVGGYSIWSTFSTNISSSDNRRIIVISTTLDSFSFIRELAIGSSGRTGVIAVMAIADALKNAVSTQQAVLKKHFLFTFFDAEQYSFAGSQRFIKDITIEGFKCNVQSSSSDTKPTCLSESTSFCTQPCYPQTYFQNINLNNIESIVEISSVGGLNTGPSGLYLHSLEDTNSVAFANRFQGTINLGSRSVQIQSSSNKILPPSSAMSFLKKKSIPAVVISDFNERINNPYFNGEFDDGLNWNQDHVNQICGLVNNTARALWSLGTESADVPSIIGANCTLVQELLECFTRNISCPLMNRLVSTDIGKEPYSPSGFTFATRPTRYHYLVKQFMHNTTGIERGPSCYNNISVCDQKNEVYCVAGQCSRSRTHYQAAYNLGIEWDYEQQNWKVVDSSVPLWTESYWDQIRMRIFKQQSLSMEGVQFGIGLVLTSITIGISLCIRKRILIQEIKEKNT